MSSDLTRQTRNRQAQGTTAAARSAELQQRIGAQASGLSQALADRVGVERFIRAAATEIRTTKNLAECTDESILGGLYVAAQLGLEVGGPRGLVYLVPYRNKDTGRYEASLIVGYKGWVDLFYRAGARAVQWFLIREGDQFRIGSDAVHGKVYSWEQTDPNSEAPYTGAVAQIITANGGVVWEYLSRADIAKRSTDTSFWRKWPDEMALKTVMRRLAATAPTSADLAIAQAADETVQRRVEVPGMPPEQHATHVPLQARPAAVEARRPAPTPPEPVSAPVENPEDNGADTPAGEELPMTDDDWETREREQHAAWLAEQDSGGR